MTSRDIKAAAAGAATIILLFLTLKLGGFLVSAAVVAVGTYVIVNIVRGSGR